MAVIHRKIVKQSVGSVDTYRIAGITSSDVAKVHKVPRGAAIKYYPTSAGTATAYSTHNSRDDSDSDDTAAELAGTGNTADWLASDSGPVTESTVDVAKNPIQTVALAPASGTWTLEVSV